MCKNFQVASWFFCSIQWWTLTAMHGKVQNWRWLPPNTNSRNEPRLVCPSLLPRSNFTKHRAGLNRGVSPFEPMRRQDTKIGGCHLAFFPITFVQGRGLNSESSWKCDHIWMQPSPETASHNLGGLTHWYSSIQSSSMILRDKTFIYL